MIEPALGSVGEANGEASLGATLRTAREAKNLSLEEVSLRINIPVKHLSALEAMELDKLPGLPFVKGYVRAYAKNMGLNADGLVAMLSTASQPKAESKVSTIDQVGPQVKLSDPMMRISLIIFVLAILGTSVWWWQTQSGNKIFDFPGLGSNTTETADTPAVVENEPASEQASDPTDIQARLAAKQEEMATMEQAISDLATDAAGESDSPAEPVADGESEPQYLTDEEIQRLSESMQSSSPVEEATDIATDAEPATVVEQQQAVTTPTGVLELTFNGDCWISIRDAGDKLVFANTKRAGETLTITLDLPASLLVGKVSAVATAKFAGESLDLAAEARKDVAKLTLGKE